MSDVSPSPSSDGNARASAPTGDKPAGRISHASGSAKRTAWRVLTRIVLPLCCAGVAGALTLFGGVTALASCGIGDPLGTGGIPADGTAADGANTADDITGTDASERVGSSSASGLNLSGISSLGLPYAVRDALEPIARQWGDALSVSFVALDDDTADELASGETALPAGSLSFNGDVVRPSASMIKLAILACLLDEAAAGQIDLQQTLELTPEDIVGGSGTLQNEAPGTTYTLEELAYHMIAESDNVATNMLIGVLGMDAVNAEAVALGLPDTALHHTMMDTVTIDPELNSTSSDDTARLLAMIASGSLVNAEASALAESFLEAQTVDTGLDAGVPDGVVVAHKTGTVEGAIHDGGIVYATKPYVLVVMTQGLEYDTAAALIEQVSSTVYAAVEDAA